jgi:hypothetical protein
VISVLYVGDFKEFYATENYVTHGLQQNGCTVYKLEEDHVTSPKAVLSVALKYKVDFVLLSKGRFQQCDEAVELLRKNGIKTVGWIFDLYFQLPTFFGRQRPIGPAHKADICCMTDGGHMEKWREFKVNHRLLRQGIHAPDAHYGTATGNHPEVVFVGTYSYKERMQLVDYLRDRYGSNFRHYGRGGDVRETRGEDLNNVLAACKIVVGDSMPSPNYWSNRIYEITGRGGFLMHPRVEGLESEFTDGVHYVGYDYGNFAALGASIDFYLAADDTREAIRWAGHEHTKANYTYTKRCAKLLQYAAEQ